MSARRSATVPPDRRRSAGTACRRAPWAGDLRGVLVAATLLALGLVGGLTAGAGVSVARAAQPRALAPADASPPTKGALYLDGQTDRWLLGGAWLYRADPGDVGVAEGYETPSSSTDGWSPVTVPNSFNTGDLSKQSQYGSVGWYRRDFTLPRTAFAGYVPKRFRSWIVRFESVNYRAQVWLNGKRIGRHAGAYLPWELQLTGLRPGVNELVVRVDSRRNPGDLPRGPNGGWWNFGGMQREVYLRAVSTVDLPNVVVRPILRCPTCAATIEEQASVRNATGSPQTISLSGTYGGRRVSFPSHTIAPHTTWIAHARLRIAHPHLWAPDDPHLYRATVTASDAAGRRLARYVTESGVRMIRVLPDGGLALNGRRLNLRGFSMHEQNISTGAALSPAQIRNIVGWDRALGGGIMRQHYPFNPQIEQAADRDGILLWSEVPVYQTASRYLTRPGWLTAAHAFLRNNILTNENHPSILVWSIANELAQPANDAEARYVSGATHLAHELDPTRPVGMATITWAGLPCQTAYAPLDVVGLNDYFDWFDSGGGTTDSLDALSPFLDAEHACYPHKALMVTEFGFEANRYGPVEVKGTYESQADLTQRSLAVFASKPYLDAAIYFPLQYFAAWPGWTGGNPRGDPPFVEKGPINLQGQPAGPLYWQLDNAFHATTQIAPAPAPPAGRRR